MISYYHLRSNLTIMYGSMCIFIIMLMKYRLQVYVICLWFKMIIKTVIYQPEVCQSGLTMLLLLFCVSEDRSSYDAKKKATHI